MRFYVIVLLLFLHNYTFAQYSYLDSILTESETNWLNCNRDKIKYAPNPYWPPGDYLDDNNIHKGIVADYISIFEERLNLTFERVYYESWPDIIEGLKNGEVDFVGAIQKTVGRDSFLLFSDPFLTVPLVVLVRDDFDEEISNIQLNEMKLACPSGYASIEFVKENYPNADIVECKDDLSALLKTSLGKTDGTVVDLLVASFLVEKYGITNLHMAKELDYTWILSFGVASECTELNSILTKVLKTVDENKRKEIFNSWISLNGFTTKNFFERNLKIILLSLLIISLLFVIILIINFSLRRIVKNRTKDLIIAKEIAEEKSLQIQKITNNLKNGMVYQVVAIDENKRQFTFISDKVKEFYGCTPDEAKANPDLIYSRVHKDDIKKLVQEELSALKNMSTFSSEIRVINPDGKIRWSQLVSSPRYFKGILYWDGIEIDITERKKSEGELIKAKKKAEESDKLKSAFLANLSHEIRTPMNSILGFSQLLKRTMLSPENKDKYIDIINTSGKYLISVIDDIIEISKIDSGMISPHNNVFNLNNSIREVFDNIKYTIPSTKDIKIVLDESNVKNNTNIFSDEVKLKQVIFNLFSNAIKYTAKGTISIGFSIQNNSTLFFYVKDSGIGIDKKFHKIIFERFWQADLGKGNLQSGSGLGLAISKSYIELMGGTIHIESEPNIGSTFSFEIPIEVVNEDSKNKPSEQSDDSVDRFIEKDSSKTESTFAPPNLTSTKRIKLLISEDEDTNYFYLSEVLSGFNYELLRARNGKEAIQLFEQNPDISLVLLDIKMPILDGYETIKLIRKVNSKIPVIAQTAYALAEDNQKISEAGFDGYIAKPIDKDDLIDIVTRNLSL